jgi:hypothetical protein
MMQSLEIVAAGKQFAFLLPLVRRKERPRALSSRLARRRKVGTSIRPPDHSGAHACWHRRAKAQGRHLNRSRINGETEQAIRTALATGKGIRKVAREVGVGVSVVQRVRAERLGQAGPA